MSDALENVRTFFDPVRVKWVATWVDGASLRAAGIAPWDGGSSLLSSNAVGAHPVPLVLGNGLTAVISDLDSSSATLGNEIVLQRLCAP